MPKNKIIQYITAIFLIITGTFYSMETTIILAGVAIIIRVSRNGDYIFHKTVIKRLDKMEKEIMFIKGKLDKEGK